MVIAEFWNATTNVPFVSLGLYSIYRGFKIHLPFRFQLCYIFLCIIGIGSFFFHATLKYEFQILDEFPMLLLAGQAIFSLIAHSMVPPVMKVITGAIIYSIILLSMFVYHVLNVAVLFQIIFGLHMVLTVVMSLRIYLKAPKPRNNGVSLGRSMLLALFYSAGAFVLWLIDRHVCENLRYARNLIGSPWSSFLQLHAWWHLLTALGLVWFIAGLVLTDPFIGPGYFIKRRFFFFPIISKTNVASQIVQ
jgi:dihydroceramidase